MEKSVTRQNPPTKPGGQPFTSLDLSIGSQIFTESVKTGKIVIWIWDGTKLINQRDQSARMKNTNGHKRKKKK